MVDKTVEESTEISIEMTVMKKSRSRSRERSFPEIMATIELEAQTIVDLGQDPELAPIGIEFIVINVGYFQGTVPLLGKKRRENSSNKCSIWEKTKQ